MEKQSLSLHTRNSSAARFDPFNSRLARDIRNALAETFVDALRQVDKSGYQQAAELWLAKNPDAGCSTYIQDRLIRYDRAFNQIAKNRIKDAKLQSLIIWNHGLFFEVHELLERIWHKTAGDEYQALKGLIQAAGVYVHLEYNHRAAAEKLAIKSSDRIQKYAHGLAFIANLNMLLENLKNLNSAPPQLLNPTLKVQ
jgi:predicted metal-dependent hydrolase